MPSAIAPIVKGPFTQAVIMFLFLVGMLMATAGSGLAQQGELRATHGAWSIMCDQPAGAAKEQCVLMQNVIADDRPEVGLSVVALKTADGKAQILRILAPMGVLLPKGLGLYVDGTNVGRTAYIRCVPDGCFAEVNLEEKLQKTFAEGKDATFIIFITPEEGIGIPVDLDGFGDGFAALP